MIYVDNSTETTRHVRKEIFNDYKLYEVENVHSYTYIDYKAWNITIGSPNLFNITNITNIYFVIDTLHHDAFAHWVFESAVYLPLYNRLKSLYPNIKLHLQCRKQYKQLFCKYFGISEENIVYEFDIHAPSICYFPSPITSLNNCELDPCYVKQLDIFWAYFKGSHEDKYVLNIMPRQVKENYKSNDRSVPLLSLIEYGRHISNCIVTHTDTIEDLCTQMDIVQNSKITVLVDGSALLVNGMFAYNKHIISAGGACTPHQAAHYVKMAHILNKIRNQNTSLSYIAGETDIISKLTELC